jgi:hypothetical protein
MNLCTACRVLAVVIAASEPQSFFSLSSLPGVFTGNPFLNPVSRFRGNDFQTVSPQLAAG